MSFHVPPCYVMFYRVVVSRGSPNLQIESPGSHEVWNRWLLGHWGQRAPPSPESNTSSGPTNHPGMPQVGILVGWRWLMLVVERNMKKPLIYSQTAAAPRCCFNRSVVKSGGFLMSTEWRVTSQRKTVEMCQEQGTGKPGKPGKPQISLTRSLEDSQLWIRPHQSTDRSRRQNSLESPRSLPFQPFDQVTNVTMFLMPKWLKLAYGLMSLIFSSKTLFKPGLMRSMTFLGYLMLVRLQAHTIFPFAASDSCMTPHWLIWYLPRFKFGWPQQSLEPPLQLTPSTMKGAFDLAKTDHPAHPFLVLWPSCSWCSPFWCNPQLCREGESISRATFINPAMNNCVTWLGSPWSSFGPKM